MGINYENKRYSILGQAHNTYRTPGTPIEGMTTAKEDIDKDNAMKINDDMFLSHINTSSYVEVPSDFTDSIGKAEKELEARIIGHE